MEKAVLLFACLFLILANQISAELIISEVELNPTGSDSGSEWIEIYSSEHVELNNWQISSNNGRSMFFNASFIGFFTLKTKTNVLTNDNNILYLLDGSKIIFTTDKLTDNSNNDKTWQYCEGIWRFEYKTFGKSNNCSQDIKVEPVNDDNSDKEEQTSNNAITIQEKTEYLELEWTNKEITNNQDFEITVLAHNLRDYSYDIKVWIESLEYDSKGELISEIYDSDSDKWISGNYYLNDIFNGGGDESEDVKLRINKKYANFSDEAKISAKLRRRENILYEVSEDIKILENEKKEEGKIWVEDNPNNYTEDITGNAVIFLNQKEDIGSNRIVYKSKKEYIREYALWGLITLCIITIILVCVQKRRENPMEEAYKEI